MYISVLIVMRLEVLKGQKRSEPFSSERVPLGILPGHVIGEEYPAEEMCPIRANRKITVSQATLSDATVDISALDKKAVPALVTI